MVRNADKAFEIGCLHLALASGNNGVARNKLGHDTTSGLNTKCEGVDIDEDDVAEGLVTREDSTLDGSTVGNSLIRVDALGRLLVEILLEKLLNLGDTSGTTNENDLERS